MLATSFTTDEINAALNSFDYDKAPEPYGFTIELYNKYILEHFQAEYDRSVPRFFRRCVINKNTNETYITLIAKKEKCLKATYYKVV